MSRNEKRGKITKSTRMQEVKDIETETIIYIYVFTIKTRMK